MGQWGRGGITPPPPRDPQVTLECSEALGDPLSLPLQTGRSHMAHGVLWALRRVEGVVASGAGDKSLVGGPGWDWASVPSLETERRKKRIPLEGGAGRCGWLAGRMYSEGCLARGGQGWGTCECLDGSAHLTPGKVSPDETRVSVPVLEGAGGP